MGQDQDRISTRRGTAPGSEGQRERWKYCEHARNISIGKGDELAAKRARDETIGPPLAAVAEGDGSLTYGTSHLQNNVCVFFCFYSAHSAALARGASLYSWILRQSLEIDLIGVMQGSRRLTLSPPASSITQTGSRSPSSLDHEYAKSSNLHLLASGSAT